MSDKQEKNYSHAGFWMTLLVTGVLISMMAFSGVRLGGVVIKRTNILSDIIDLGVDSALILHVEELDEQLMLLAESTVPTNEQYTAPVANQRSKIISKFASQEEQNVLKRDTPIVPIEDFGDSTGVSMNNFYLALAEQPSQKSVRIAVVGDSFIEGDIFTADVREQLQGLYSGRGVGFVPFSSDVSQFWGTINQKQTNWKTYTSLKLKSLPDQMKGRFFISCTASVPMEGAKSVYEGSKMRKYIRSSSSATLLFTNEIGSTINVTINDTIEHSFTPERSPYPQTITLETEIYKLSVAVDKPEGFYGYGVAFEDRKGVNVDNYSLRSNSGSALFGTTYEINSRVNELRPIDLIVVEYGLNVLSSEVINYGFFTKQMVRIINYLKACYPKSAILVMGVADRSTMQGGEFVTMPSVAPMIAAQRRAAQECGVAFWNTFAGMGGEGSMVKFVENQWAAKDYTHISYAGGRRIATSFVRAIVEGKVKSMEQL